MIHQWKKSYTIEYSESLTTLKHKPKVQIKATTTEETEITEKQTYTEILSKSGNPSRRQNIKNLLRQQHYIQLKKYQKLLSMNPNKKHQKQG